MARGRAALGRQQCAVGAAASTLQAASQATVCPLAGFPCIIRAVVWDERRQAAWTRLGCQCFLEGIFQHKVDLVLRSALWPKFREHVLAVATYV